MTSTPTPAMQSVGRILGLIAALLLPLGLLAAIRNRRRLQVLRELVDTATARTALLENRLASVSRGYAPMVAQPALAAAAPAPTRAGPTPGVPFELHRAPRRATRAAIGVGLGLGLALAGAAAYAVIESGVIGRAKHHAHPLPTAPVVVLNAGQVPHAAHRLGLSLTRHHVHVISTGNLGAAPPSSYEILYRPGDAGQARLLAAILKAQNPRVAPLNAATARAIGPAPKLVVVIP